MDAEQVRNCLTCKLLRYLTLDGVKYGWNELKDSPEKGLGGFIYRSQCWFPAPKIYPKGKPRWHTYFMPVIEWNGKKTVRHIHDRSAIKNCPAYQPKE